MVQHEKPEVKFVEKKIEVPDDILDQIKYLGGDFNMLAE